MNRDIGICKGGFSIDGNSYTVFSCVLGRVKVVSFVQFVRCRVCNWCTVGAVCLSVGTG
jgi:hypothetical protein